MSQSRRETASKGSKEGPCAVVGASRESDEDIQRRPKGGFAVGSNGLILRTEDGGLTWTDNESPVQTNLFSVTAIGKRGAVAVGELGTVLVTEDGGVTWLSQKNITGRVLQAIEPAWWALALSVQYVQ